MDAPRLTFLGTSHFDGSVFNRSVSAVADTALPRGRRQGAPRVNAAGQANYEIAGILILQAERLALPYGSPIQAAVAEDLVVSSTARLGEESWQ